MRLKEDNTNWQASSVQRRDFRHTYGEPEVPKHRKSKKKKSKPKGNGCKHVWVEVSYNEYQRYVGTRGRWTYYWITNFETPLYAEYYTFYVCADCLECKTKVDKGKQRQVYRKRYGRSW